MAYRRLQNILAESRVMLPFAALVAVGTCYLAGFWEGRLWMEALCLLCSAYLMVEMSNTHQLIRVYGMMVPTMFLLLECASTPLLSDLRSGIMQLCAIAVFTLLFRCYQQRRTSGWVYYGFFCLGISSMVFAQVLYYVPIFWLMMYFHLRSLSLKSFCASVIGIVTPYWLGMAYVLYTGDTTLLLRHTGDLFTFGSPFDFSSWGEHEMLAAAWTLLLALTGMIHYARQGYHDKTRTRMYYAMLITVDLLTIAFLAIQPQHYYTLMPLIVVCTTPLIAHFMTLTGTWLTNICFHLILIGTLAIIFYNAWMPSSSFLSSMAIWACSYLPL